MRTIHAIYENGVFRPTTPVDLPEGYRVTIDTSGPESASGQPLTEDDAGLDDVYEILSRRYRSGHTDTAEKHNEHQP